ncbi:MAG TPA: SpvB/TcaC N-terminal domain-containing protein [Thermodesulfobacteriota bacterium]|nr:SpvB/TcaC N-terminal domain-containing protein [Thermodesulfobacteriota bacterium]
MAMINNEIKESKNNKNATTNQSKISLPSISLPKGGGAIRGIGEKFSANPVTGTGALSVPIFTTPSRSDFYPKLLLSYDSGAGNGPFGLGWDLPIPSISRKTEKGLPKYRDAEDSDTFILSGAEDLVPSLIKNGNEWAREIRDEVLDGESYTVQRYRPRIEGLFARIERWKNKNKPEDVFWKSISKDNITSVYGKSPKGKIFDPEDKTRIFKWLLEESYDDKGNVILYEYKEENQENVDRSLPQEKNRLGNGTGFANRYLKHIKYGNGTPFRLGEDLSRRRDWLLHVVFDYGEHDKDKPEIDNEVSKWPTRPDAFSSYKATFEIRTYRLCHRVLMFHHFAELGDTPCLIRSTDFKYNDSDPIQGPVACYLTSVTQTGYIRDEQTGDYQKKSFPSLEFAYNERTINEEIHVSDAESLENLPIGLDGAQYQWVDLDGEGISGILTEQADGWFYKRNLGNAQFTPAEAVPLIPPPPLMTLPPPPSMPSLGDVRFAPVQVVSTKPSVANLQGGQQQFMDLAGDGQLDLVQFSDPLPGYYERDDDGEWKPFTPFVSTPNIAWNDPNLRFIDLNGDGHADILISEDEVFVWYPSRAEEGFGPAEIVRKPYDEEKGPVLVFADSTQSIYLADMSGDGLTDIARIRNGEVCYWPNLGYGRFGAKVTMDAAPIFDYPEYFNQNRIRLADIDGSGTTDIIYLGRDSITFRFNQAGNSWSEPHRLSNFPPTDNFSSVTVVDLLGNGTACIVWSSPLPAANGHPMQYIDLMGGVKPHLLKTTKNNMGAETRVQYAPSTKFYLEDLAAGTPWITRLPFPVHVVERVETRDYVSNTKLVTLYKYHHGYYDGEEREFRGFGLVEQWDTEFFDQSKGHGLFDEEPDNSDEVFHLPPVYTKSWFHTGAFFDRDNISKHFVEEYYKGDPQAILLPDTILPSGLTNAKEEHEACRALKGSMLRQEIYALDNSPKSEHPYTVTETAYKLRLLQPRQDGQYAVFYSYQCEALSYHYERNPEDPRIGHSMTLEVDDFGNVTKSAAIGYRRRVPAFDEQKQTLITYTENQVINKPNDGPNDPDWYRIGVPVETRTFEITGILSQKDVPYTIDDVRDAIQTTTDIPYEVHADLIMPQKRLIEHVRSLYYKNNLSGPLPLGEVESLALPYESYKLAFTPGLLTEVYGSRVNDNLLRDEGKYIKAADYKAQGLFPAQDQDAVWWIPSGQQLFETQHTPSNRNPFYLSLGVKDPFGNISLVAYDAHSLLVTETNDPLGNIVKAKNHYRTMAPQLVTDPNGNRAAARFDALGMVIATFVMGKPELNEGDRFDVTSNEASNQDDPTSRLEYDLFANMNDPQHRQPVFVHTFAREQHGSANPRWQESYSYSDGFGREVMKKIQAEPGMAPARDGNGKLKHDANNKLVFEFTNTRWVGTGRTVFDNKGNPVKKYEPFFDSIPKYEDERELVEWGVTPILRYDPLGRLIRTDNPNGTFSKVEFDPWQQMTFDENDTVRDSRWYADRGSPDPNGAEPTDPERRAAYLAAKHANTKTIAHSDTLGRTFLTIADNGTAGKYETHVELDIEGNQRSVTDALGRINPLRPKVMTYDYDMLGTGIHQVSMDAGERWMLNNVAGKPIRVWDSRGHEIKTTYDELQRPTHLFVKHDTDPEILVERNIYGEAHPDSIPPAPNVPSPSLLNLRGKVYQVFDGAGIVTNEKYDFKGNLLSSRRQLAKEYKKQVNWLSLATITDVQAIANAAALLLETKIFTASTTYDALNRPTKLITPHNSTIPPSEILPTYNEANLLEKVDVRLRGAATPTPFVTDIDYNAKGQREFISYGNGVSTTYEYDDKTFRLIHLLTTRNNGTDRLQDLKYTYDPVGNITQIRDDAQQTVFFNNGVVSPSTKYEYDAIYRLTKAEGREHVGQTANNLPEHRPELKPHYDFNDSTQMNLPHPNDGQAMRNYTESYEYDPVGNILKMIHSANGGSWTRRYDYESTNNRLRSTSLPNDPATGTLPVRYEYDPHGNMTKMPHLMQMDWGFKDQLHRVDLGGGGEAYYVYDSAGQRVRKVIERQGTTIEERIYLGGFEIYRKRNGGGLESERETLHIMDDKKCIALVETKTRDNGIVLTTPKPITRYQFDNHLGSASLELDENGAVISYEEYYPYGSTSYQAGRSVAEVSLKRYRYTGKERDEETGLYYHGARHYAPWLGRWTSCDPIGLSGGLNLFVYARSDPLGYVDVSGLQPEEPKAPPKPKPPEAGKHPEGVLAESKFNRAWEEALERRYGGGSPARNQQIYLEKLAEASDKKAFAAKEYAYTQKVFKDVVKNDPELSKYDFADTELHHIEAKAADPVPNPERAVDPNNLLFTRGKAKSAGTSHNVAQYGPGEMRRQQWEASRRTAALQPSSTDPNSTSPAKTTATAGQVSNSTPTPKAEATAPPATAEPPGRVTPPSGEKPTAVVEKPVAGEVGGVKFRTTAGVKMGQVLLKHGGTTLDLLAIAQAENEGQLGMTAAVLIAFRALGISVDPRVIAFVVATYWVGSKVGSKLGELEFRMNQSLKFWNPRNRGWWEYP